MNNEPKILVADDHPLMIDGLKWALKNDLNLEITSQAMDGKQAYNLLKEQNFDIVTLDVEMPGMNGLEIARRIVEEKINTKIVFLTMYNDEDIFNEAMELGAYGFLLKENAVEDIIDCVKAVNRGEYYLSPEISKYLVKRQNKLKKLNRTEYTISDLTKTERLNLKIHFGRKNNKRNC